jgi:hypothetical protein
MKVVVICAALAAGAAVLALGEYSGSYVVPLDHEAIQYAKLPVDDAATRLERSIAGGKAQLEFEENTGYLRSLLKALDVPVESQVLVFSKTSFQAPRIGPGTPRALYFNDTVSIGYVRGGDVVEVAALDPKQGTIFYTLDQDPAVKPAFVRRDTACLQCHASGGTAGVPGLFVRSVYPEPTGMPLFHAGGFVTDHRSPFKERWGGWYVTGTHGQNQTHMGNAFARDRSAPDQLERDGTQNVTSLQHRFDTGAYLSPHSDLVALMVLEHQTRMWNLLTRLGWETRMAVHSQAEMNRILKRPENELSESAERRIGSGVEEVLGYMLFVDEAPLSEPVAGTSGFAKVFASRGPLRDFDLKTRLFRLPCSYMIYSEAFDALPDPAKERLYRRLWQVLNGEDKTAKFAKLTAEQRRDILETLRKTKKGLPDYWKS